MLKGLRHRDAFLLIVFTNIATIAFYLTSVKRHINDKTNQKSQSLRLGSFAVKYLKPQQE